MFLFSRLSKNNLRIAKFRMIVLTYIVFTGVTFGIVSNSVVHAWLCLCALSVHSQETRFLFYFRFTSFLQNIDKFVAINRIGLCLWGIQNTARGWYVNAWKWRSHTVSHYPYQKMYISTVCYSTHLFSAQHLGTQHKNYCMHFSHYCM